MLCKSAASSCLMLSFGPFPPLFAPEGVRSIFLDLWMDLTLEFWREAWTCMEITIVEIGRSTDCMFGVSIASFCRLIMRSSFVIGPHRARIASNALHFFTRPIDPSPASQPTCTTYCSLPCHRHRVSKSGHR